MLAGDCFLGITSLSAYHFIAPRGLDFVFAATATKPFDTLAAVLFAARPRFAGAAVVVEGFVVDDFAVDFFAAARKFFGFVASIPMTRR